MGVWSSLGKLMYWLLLCYSIAGKVGGEFTLADWQFLCPPPKYNPPNILLFVTIKYL